MDAWTVAGVFVVAAGIPGARALTAWKSADGQVLRHRIEPRATDRYKLELSGDFEIESADLESLAQPAFDFLDFAPQGARVRWERRATLRGECVSADAGRATRLDRSYERLASRLSFSSFADGGLREDEVRLRSPLEERGIGFEWDPESEVYAAKLADDVEEDKRWLAEDLLVDLELQNLLPKRAVAPGDEWRIDLSALRTILQPGGHLKLHELDGAQPQAEGFVVLSARIFELGWEAALIDGEVSGRIRARYRGERTVGERAVCVIDLEVDCELEGDLAERYSELAAHFELPEFRWLGPGEPGSPFHADIRGVGELCWDPAEDRLAAFTFRGELEASAEPQFEMAFLGRSAALSFDFGVRGIVHMSIERAAAE